MTDRERIVELGRAGFSKETTAAILGLELEDVVAVRAGLPSETAARPGQVSYNEDVELVEAALGEFVSAPTPDRVEFEVVTGGIWFAFNCLLTTFPTNGSFQFDLLIDGEGAKFLGDETLIGDQTYSIGDEFTLEEVLDPDFIWTMFGSFAGSGLFDIQTNGPTLDEVGVFGEGGLHALSTMLALPNGPHSLEIVYAPWVDFEQQLAVAKRRLQVWP